MQNVVERVINLLIYLIDSPVPVTANDVRHKVHGYQDQSDVAFHKMFERDKDVLRRLGVPLKMKALDVWEVDKGYSVDPEEYAIPDPGLSKEERVALSVAARMVRLGGADAGAGALLKLGGIERGDGIEPLTADLGQEADKLGELFTAIGERRRVEFTYRDQPRLVEPYGMSHQRGRWYLVAGTPEGERVYRVDRIADLVVTEKPNAFTKPRGFDVRKATSTQPWEAGADPAVDAEVRFDADVAWWAARSLGLAPPEGELTATVTVTNRDAFVGWLLSFGAEAEVLSPSELREAVADHVAGALGQLP